jgi:RimJ/RimL family protein N-acetyltransferase
MEISIESRATARLYLRRLVLEDVPAVTSIESDPRTNQHRPGGAPSPEESAKTVREFVRGWDENGVGYWAVEFDSEVIGLVGVRPFFYLGRECWNLYYRLSPDAWGKGFAAASASEAVSVATTLQPEWPVVARTRPTNVASSRVAEKVGLQRHSDLDSDGFFAYERGW